MKLSEILIIIEQATPKKYKVIAIEYLNFRICKEICIPHYKLKIVAAKNDVVSSFTLFIPKLENKKKLLKEIKENIKALFKEGKD